MLIWSLSQTCLRSKSFSDLRYFSKVKIIFKMSKFLKIKIIRKFPHFFRRSKFFNSMFEGFLSSVFHSLTHSLTHTLPPSLVLSLTHSPTHPPSLPPLCFVVGQCNIFCFGIFFRIHVIVWEEFGGPEKDQQISSCPAKDIFYSSGPEKD